MTADGMSSSAPQSDELLWQALQYLSGELSSSEAEEFEARLAEDCDLCEALSRAVVLSEAVIACERDSHQSRVVARPVVANPVAGEGLTSAPTRRRSIAVLGTVAALAILVAVAGWQVRPGASVSPLTLPSGEVAQGQSVLDATALDGTGLDATGPESVLALWISLGAERDGDDVEPAWDSARDASADDSDADVPGWMMAALLASSDVRRLDREGHGLDPVDSPQQEGPL